MPNRVIITDRHTDATSTGWPAEESRSARRSAADCSRVAVVMRDGPQCYLHRPPCGCCDEWTDRPWEATPLAPEEAESLINDRYRRFAGIRAIIYPAKVESIHPESKP